MELLRTVKLNPYERERCAIAVRHLPLAYPHVDTDPPSQARALIGLGRQGTASPDKLLLARTALEELVAVCAVQSDRGHWEATLNIPSDLQPTGPQDRPSSQPGQPVPILGDPAVVAEALIDARRLALREVHAALAIVHQALALVAEDENLHDQHLATV